MRRVCAWCKKEMGTKEDNSGNDIVTHGICPECEKLLKYDPVITKDLLNEFEEPVLLLDVDVRCLVANSSASKALDKKIDSIEGCFGGDVICCVHAKEPGGCGETEHCSGCTIRNIVEDTFKTGRRHLKVQIYNFIQTIEGIKKTKFLISAEKRGNRVLLRID